MRRYARRKGTTEAELDITAFMSLMIVLVPVLLMSMVFNHITVLQLSMPDLLGGQATASSANKPLEVHIQQDGFTVYFPSGVLVQRIPAVKAAKAGTERHDYQRLSLVLREIKRQLLAKAIDKKDILLLSQANIDYQTLVSTMDTVRSYKAVVATEVVDAELFPEIALGDAPVRQGGKR